jgi:hypothetical protein
MSQRVPAAIPMQEGDEKSIPKASESYLQMKQAGGSIVRFQEAPDCPDLAVAIRNYIGPILAEEIFCLACGSPYLFTVYNGVRISIENFAGSSATSRRYGK